MRLGTLALGVVVAGVVVATCPSSASGLVLNSGYHVISYDVGGSLDIEGTSQVVYQAGGKAYSIGVSDNAELNMTGGEIGTSLCAFGGRSTISGGIFNTSGVLTSGIFASGNAEVIIDNVSVDVVDTLGSSMSMVTINSGSVEWAVNNIGYNIHSRVDIRGGFLNTSGGGINSGGEINIFGGVFQQGTFLTGGSSGGAINIFGTSFNYPFGTIPDSSGTITGTLSDGNAFQADFLGTSPDQSRKPAVITLFQVPEPSTSSLLVLAALVLAAVALQRRCQCWFSGQRVFPLVSS